MNQKVLFIITKIISGGQTGADRATLDFAIKHNVPHGGWLPRGRLTENGKLPDCYQLQEMPTPDYSKRTEQNVLDSDGTIIVSHGRLTGGSSLTEHLAEKHKKPCIHIDLSNLTTGEASIIINNWVQRYKIAVLNIAGPRDSKDPIIYKATMDLLETAFLQNKDNQ